MEGLNSKNKNIEGGGSLEATKLEKYYIEKSDDELL